MTCVYDKDVKTINYKLKKDMGVIAKWSDENVLITNLKKTKLRPSFWKVIKDGRGK